MWALLFLGVHFICTIMWTTIYGRCHRRNMLGIVKIISQGCTANSPGAILNNQLILDIISVSGQIRTCFLARSSCICCCTTDDGWSSFRFGDMDRRRTIPIRTEFEIFFMSFLLMRGSQTVICARISILYISLLSSMPGLIISKSQHSQMTFEEKNSHKNRMIFVLLWQFQRKISQDASLISYFLSYANWCVSMGMDTVVCFSLDVWLIAINWGDFTLRREAVFRIHFLIVDPLHNKNQTINSTSFHDLESCPASQSLALIVYHYAGDRRDFQNIPEKVTSRWKKSPNSSNKELDTTKSMSMAFGQKNQSNDDVPCRRILDRWRYFIQIRKIAEM